MAWFSSKVKVTFIDDATGDSLGSTEMPPADLPESFELDTTLHFGNEDWSVVNAQPKTRAEYEKSKKLILRLGRVEAVNPSNILFSLPSICDSIPGVTEHKLSGNEFILAEDDWRQFELVSNDYAADVDDELKKIRLIHENASAEVGWREIHVRSKPESPITCGLALADLANSLNVTSDSVGVTYCGAQSRIAHGYAFRTNDLTVYGVVANGNVQVIAFEQYSDVSPEPDSIDRIKSLARNLNLDLVYWCRCARVGPDDPLFESLLAK